MTHRILTSALLASLALPAVAQDMPETEFNVVGSIGTLSMYTAKELPFWTTEIPEASGGKIKVQVKPFTELGFKGGEIFRLVSNGTLQMATTVLAYNSGEVPTNEATDLVGLVGSVGQLHEVADSFRPTYADFLETQHNIKLLGYGTYQAQVIYCRDEFTSIADLKGRKVRASGASQQAFVDYLGGSPLSIAFAEVQPALASGVVDCAITGALSGYKAKWHESARFISPMPVTFGLAAHLANLDWWNGLDASVQGLLEAELKGLEDSIFELAATETETGLACNTSGPCPEGEPAGMTLVAVTEEDEALRAAALKAVILPAFAERCGADCTATWNETVGAFLDITIE
ncbi:TRAP transporter substrate-binding protein [Puniceibacterium sp. IMCC21224]|uniref:TRAP transporter substrate-binding protein n=1 Tax=Puniceibacterium sp. IMCC21224 TaxID=1618204 RepID=UPI00064DD7BB|nr:TRAP transporter substrate-binding protein [Puniceibacterium sp. IMCC21224]KMK66330.1 TRAP-type C4-dicarboxylate transport system, periplasmic component [Puniceibacterium sp. IMCC21224]